MKYESSPTIDKPESNFKEELLNPAMPKNMLAAEQIFNAVDGGIQNVKYLNPDEKKRIKELISEFVEASEVANPENQKKKKDVIAEVKNIMDTAFDREVD